MKILLTGGGSGGHFYPVMAIAESLKKITAEHNIPNLKLFYMSTDPYDQKVLDEIGVIYVHNSAGKVRRYFSIQNFFDLFKTGWGIITSVWRVFSIFPDVVFGKGGYASFPALFAARILRIPVVIHESDTIPGKVNRWAGKFAARVAVSYPFTTTYFNAEHVAVTGQPVREDIKMTLTEGSHRHFGLDPHLPTVLILGGSQGAVLINDIIMEILPELLRTYQVIHQTGESNFAQIKETAEAALYASEYKDRYKPFPYLQTLSLRMAAGASDLIVSRAGSTIFEIASWQKPSIIIPITDSNGDHQRKNAYEYARSGAATVIEEQNLTKNILLAEIDRIVRDTEIKQAMQASAQSFFKAGAEDKIASEIIEIALEHNVKK